MNTCYLKFALCNLPHWHWTKQKWVWGKGLGLQNWWPLGQWSKDLSQKNLWHMQITIFSWQQGGNLWTSIVYTMMILKVFNEMSMNFATFKNRKHFYDLPAQYSGLKNENFTIKKKHWKGFLPVFFFFFSFLWCGTGGDHLAIDLAWLAMIQQNI